LLIYRNLGEDNEYAKIYDHIHIETYLIQYLDALAREMLENLMVMTRAIPVPYSVKQHKTLISV